MATRHSIFMLDRLSQAAGRPLSVDCAVFEPERRTGHRNRAIAHLLLNFGMVHDQAEDALRRLLSAMRDPGDLPRPRDHGSDPRQYGPESLDRDDRLRHRQRAKHARDHVYLRKYDYSGEWAYRVGVPAKSGVSGGVMAVVNRQLGIATFSPRLDQRGNSFRGIQVCAELASRFGLHAFDCLNVGSSFLDTVLEN